MKILLLYPMITLNKGSIKKCEFPTGMGYIAAYLEKYNHEVHCIDISLEGYENEVEHNGMITFGLNDEEIKYRIKQINPELIGISCPFSSQFHNAIHLSRLCKKVSDAKIIIGGAHPTFKAEEILKKVDTIDYIAMGEGEEIFLDLANNKQLSKIDGLAYRKNRIIINKPRALIKNLDELPFPAWHLFNMQKYLEISKPQNPFTKGKRVMTIASSRGCAGKCIFCSSSVFWRRYIRFRSPHNIINEMKELIDKYNIDEFQFEDDNLTGWPKRAKELFKKMIPLKIKWCTPNGVKIDTIDKEMLKLMKQSGCYRITYAMESGNQEVLNKIIKKPYDLEKAREIVKLTKRIGIEVHTYWIIGFPGETEKQMWETFNYAKSLKTDSSSVCLATPMVGSELLKMCREQNLLRKGFDVDTAPYTESWIKHPELKKEQLEWMCKHFNNKLNSGLFFRNPIRFFRKYGKTIKENPKNIFNLFKKFS